MCDQHRRGVLGLTFGALAVVAAGSALAQEPPPKAKVYVCPPCGCPSDGKEFADPGACPDCGMTLVEKDKPPAPSLVSR